MWAVIVSGLWEPHHPIGRRRYWIARHGFLLKKAWKPMDSLTILTSDWPCARPSSRGVFVAFLTSVHAFGLCSTSPEPALPPGSQQQHSPNTGSNTGPTTGRVCRKTRGIHRNNESSAVVTVAQHANTQGGLVETARRGQNCVRVTYLQHELAIAPRGWSGTSSANGGRMISVRQDPTFTRLGGSGTVSLPGCCGQGYASRPGEHRFK